MNKIIKYFQKRRYNKWLKKVDIHMFNMEKLKADINQGILNIKKLLKDYPNSESIQTGGNQLLLEYDDLLKRHQKNIDTLNESIVEKKKELNHE